MTSSRRRALFALWGLVLVGALAVGYVLLTPSLFGASVTELYVLDESGVAANYPDDLAVGETGTVIVGVSNDRSERRTYTVVVSLGDRTVRRYRVELDAREVDERPVSFTPEEPGRTELRVALHEGEVAEGAPGWTVTLPVDVGE